MPTGFASPMTDQTTDTIHETAAHWCLRLQGPVKDTELDDFSEWLAQNPAHIEAFRRVSTIWVGLGQLADHPEIVRRLDAASDYFQAASRRAAVPTRKEPWHRARYWVGLAASAFIVLTVGIVASLVTSSDKSAEAVVRYQTDLGERRSFRLEDGSLVALDERSNLEVRYSQSSRSLELFAGQARFDVARDTERPFQVKARGQLVHAKGTAFNIDLMTSETVITLLEGYITVAPAKERDSPAPEASAERAAVVKEIEMEPGEQLILSERRGIVVTKPARLDDAVSWETGKVVFVDEPLGLAAERMGHYAGQRLLVSGEEATAMRVSGVFDTSDVHGFVEAVTSYLPVTSVVDADGSILLTATSVARD